MRNNKVLLTIHIVLLSIFVMVTSLMLVTTIINRVRIRPVRMAWYNCAVYKGIGRSLLLLLAMISVVVYSGVTENGVYLYLGVGYFTGGLCWLAASRISSATLVTDFAIIRNTNKKGNVLGWSQVTDFFIHETGSAFRYVFLYKQKDGRQGRFELMVPLAYEGVFKKVVHRCVEKRTLPEKERAYG